MATYLAEVAKASVCILDADPNQPIYDWKTGGQTSSTVHVIGGIRQETIMKEIGKAAASYQFVFVDLEGTASLLLTRAVAFADLVIVPMQPSAVDGRQAARAVQTVEEEEALMRANNPKRRLPYRILLTRTGAVGAPTSSSQRRLEEELEANGILRFQNTLAERQPYKALFEQRLTLHEMGSLKVGNLDAAIKNAGQVCNELVSIVQSINQREVA